MKSLILGMIAVMTFSNSVFAGECTIKKTDKGDGKSVCFNSDTQAVQSDLVSTEFYAPGPEMRHALCYNGGATQAQHVLLALSENTRRARGQVFYRGFNFYPDLSRGLIKLTMVEGHDPYKVKSLIFPCR